MADERLQYDIGFFRRTKERTPPTASEFDEKLEKRGISKKQVDISNDDLWRAPNRYHNRHHSRHPNPQALSQNKRPMRSDGRWRAHRAEEKLFKSDGHWNSNKDKDTPLQRKTKAVSSLLNKITIDNFDNMLAKIMAVEVTETAVAQSVIEVIFEKAVYHPRFAKLYAQLCDKLDKATHELYAEIGFVCEKGESMTLKKALLRLLMDEYRLILSCSEAILPADHITEAAADFKNMSLGTRTPEEKAAKEANETLKEKEMKKKDRKIGVIAFLGELHLINWISEKAIRARLSELLEIGANEKKEILLELFKNLLECVGKHLSQFADGAHLDGYRDKILAVSQDTSYSNRMNSLFRDLLEMQDKHWVPRREKEGMTAVDHDLRKRVAELPKDMKSLKLTKSRGQSRHSGPRNPHHGGSRGRGYPQRGSDASAVCGGRPRRARGAGPSGTPRWRDDGKDSFSKKQD